MKFQTIRIFFYTLTLFSILFHTSEAFTQTCDSSDKRDMVEQLDCYCSPNDKSIMQQKVDNLRVMNKKFRHDCNSAVLMTLAYSKDNKVSPAISKKLETLKYSKEQADAIIGQAEKRASYYKLIKSGEQNLNAIPEKHRKLFEFIDIPVLPGPPILTTDIEKLQIALSIEVLGKINQSTSVEVQCIVNNLTDGKTTSRHLEQISEMLERYEYHDSGYISCKADHEFLTNKDLKNIKDKLWENELLRNEIPSEYCRGRSFLTSKILDDMGFKSKILSIKRGKTILATYKTKDGFKLDAYLEHFANIVVVRENGKDVEYVIDPMFTEGPVQLDEYIKSATFPGEKLEYDFRHQSYADKLVPPLSDEICKYNVKLLKDYENSIQESLVTPPPTFLKKAFKSPEEAKKSYIKTIREYNSYYSGRK